MLGLLGACAIGVAFILPAAAQSSTSTSSVTQEIRGGGLNASITAASMTPVNYSNDPNESTGVLNLSVSDATGSSAGWNVAVSSSDFVYQGTSPTGADIPSTDFSITTPHDPTLVAGQAIDATGGPYAVDGGSLDTARTTIAANAGFGSGNYAQALDVHLDIPARSQTGSYVATLTVLITSGP
jgi:hypothetical protein